MSWVARMMVVPLLLSSCMRLCNSTREATSRPAVGSSRKRTGGSWATANANATATVTQDSPQSRGCHALIKQGAKLVESAQDVLEELKIPLPKQSTASSSASHEDSTEADDLSDAENGLLAALGFDPVGLDALQARTGIPTAQLQADLMTLELEGLVSRLPGGLFQRLTVV